MPVTIARLDPARYRRTPWKNGGGEMVVIADGGGEGWGASGVAWHFGRTAIVQPGPFSDLSGFERLQVVIKGRGLVLVTPTSEISLRMPFQTRRYDGGTPIVTRLEDGAVEVVNLIADRKSFDINLRVGEAGEAIDLAPGEHIVHAPVEPVAIEIAGQHYELPEDHALRAGVDAWTDCLVVSGRALIGSIHPAPR
jgi:environmental stress-induced protein Ves